MECNINWKLKLVHRQYALLRMRYIYITIFFIFTSIYITNNTLYKIFKMRAQWLKIYYTI